MTELFLNDFNRQLECTYKGELYSVRDNGAVFRHSPNGKRPRPTDNKWTFGKKNDKTGYMEIATVRVHRIVATAFHGNPPTSEHVVDHIDTNRCNNRPENLRWLTRLENALLNPITVKRIESVCGSIEAFLENPSLLRNSSLERNYEWMRAVTSDEAKVCLDRMHIWAKSDKRPSGGQLGEWIYKPNPTLEEDRPEIVSALTPNAAQRNWQVPSEFPCCPKIISENPIDNYFKNLAIGNVLSQNKYSKSVVANFAITESQEAILVMCGQPQNSMKPWSLAKITFEGGLYVHTSLGTFFSQMGAEKQFTLEQGKDWNGEDSVDDFC